MRPFYKYYGSKYILAKQYGSPRHDLVIEPFAGSACYSLYYNCRNVRLYDIDDEICEIWNYLINCSEQDIKSLPDWIESIEHLNTILQPAQQLIRRWLWCAPTANGRRKLSKRYHISKDRGDWNSIWSTAVKRRILQQKPLIANWTIDKCSYEHIPNVEAHWHIDPPYNSKAGQAYRHNSRDINFTHLAEWCKSRNGTVDVCEMEGADWLPFTTLCSVINTRRRKYTEVVWRKGYTERQLELF